MGYIAATKFTWTVMFNRSEASGPLRKGRARQCIKTFRGQRGVQANPLEPPSTRACYKQIQVVMSLCEGGIGLA